MKLTAVGVDVAKRVFQLHWIEPETGEIISKQIKRAVFLEHFANRAPCLIGMEACGGAQHRARRLIEMGHQVRLMPGKAVKAFVSGNKNDVADARAIWTAVQQSSVKSVAVKSEAQQAVLALHRMRQQLIKFRTMQSNGLRGLLTEYGEVMAVGRAALNKAIPDVLARLSERLPAVLVNTLREQWSRLAQLDEQIGEIERRLAEWMKEDRSCRKIAEVPGIGLLTATAAVATMGDAKAFTSGREFAAWLGLVPGQVGTGGNPTRVPIEQKESWRWLENMRQSTMLLGEPTRCIHIGDRESDIYELFNTAYDLCTHFLVRTCVDRLAGDGQHTIAKAMQQVKVKGLHRVELRDAKGRPMIVTLELRYQRMTVLPPVGKQGSCAALQLTVLHAQERDPPPGRPALNGS
jgi:transposase